MSVRILVVEDEDKLRRVIELQLKGAGFEVEQAGSAEDALKLADRADVILTDLRLPGMTGLELVRRIKTEFTGVRVLVLSMHAEEQYALRAFKAGANGYVTKDIAATELVGAVNRVAAGGVYVTASLAERVVRQLNGTSDAPRHMLLTDREFEVLRRVACGQRLTEIGDALHLSVKTVSTHKARIQEKLEVSSTAELIRYALENSIE